MCGSRLLLIAIIVLIPIGPYSSNNSSIFPRPIPCSPVQVPPTRRDRLYGNTLNKSLYGKSGVYVI